MGDRETELRELRDDIARQLAELDARVVAVEKHINENPHRPARRTQAETGEPDYWVLRELEERYDQPVVVFGGTADTPRGTVQWQYGRMSEHLLNTDPTATAPALEAIAHPIRLTLLLAIINGTTTSAELVKLDQVGTSGQVYHHLSQLSAAGWIKSVKRGQWEVPPAKVVPLLTIILATQV